MKKYLLIIFLFIGCSDNVPDNLISKEKMENIIFDIMILNAASGFDLKIDNNLLSVEKDLGVLHCYVTDLPMRFEELGNIFLVLKLQMYN